MGATPIMLLLAALAIVFFLPIYLRYWWQGVRSTWAELTGPNWLFAWISYFLAVAAGGLYVPFFGGRTYGPAYPNSPWRPAVLVASIGLLIASVVLQFKYVHPLRKSRRRYKKQHARVPSPKIGGRE